MGTDVNIDMNMVKVKVNETRSEVNEPAKPRLKPQGATGVHHAGGVRSTRTQRSAWALTLVGAVALLSLGASGPLQASPEKAAKFYDDAQNRYEKGDLAGAAVQLKNALQEDKKMLSAHLLLGRVLLRAGELKAAEAALEEALARGVSKSEVAALLGQVYLLLGEAKKLLDNITTAGVPQNMHPDILTLRGTAHAMTGNLSGAAQAFAEARNLDPKSAGPYIAEAPILLRAGEREKARVAAQRSVELAPDNASAWYQMGTILHALSDAPGAMAAFDKALGLNARHVDARVSRSALLLNLRRDDEASKELAQLKDWKVVEPRASFLRGTLAAKRGDLKVAREEFADAASLIDALAPPVRNGSEPLLLAGAMSHRALGQAEKAREYCDALLSRNGRHFAATLLMAGILLDAKEYNRAQPLLDALQRTAPEDSQVLFMVGTLQLAKRQYAQAAESFDRAAKGGSNEAMRELGFSQLGLGQDKLAIANLEKSLAKDPSDYRAGVQLATMFARQGNSARAVQIAEALVKIDPANVAMINFLGNVKGRLGDMAGASEAFKLAISKDPKFRPAVMNLSWLDMDERRFDEARKRLTEFMKSGREDPDLLYQLGVLEERARRPAEAMVHWKRAEQMQKQDPRPGLAIIELLTAQRQSDQALLAAKALSSKMPTVLPVHLALARSYMATGDMLLTRQTLLEATKLAGFDPQQLVLVGRMQLQVGNVEGAQVALNKALQSSPDDVGALVLQVETAARGGNTAAMDAAMTQLAAKQPAHPATFITRANIAMSRGQLPEAVKHYAAAMDKEPNTPTALMLANAHIGAREPQKALSLLEAWARRSPSDRVFMRALAEVQLLNGKTDSAKRSYGAIVATDPNDPEMLASYAQLLQRLNDPSAITTAEKALKLAPNNPVVPDTLGWMMVQQGQAEAGVRHLRDARLREPANGLIRYHLAVGLAKAGRRNEAKDELQAALASGGGYASPEDISRLRAELGL